MSLQEEELNSKRIPSSEDSAMDEKEDTRSSVLLWKQKTSSLLSVNEKSGLKIESTDISRSSDLENPSRYGWVVVAAACLLMTPVAGFVGSFGNFVGPLSGEFEASRFITGCVGSAPFGLGLGLVPFSTILINKYGIRPVCFMGALAWLIGLISSSYVESIYLMFLTYSFLIGIGCNFAFNPTMLLVGKYFPNKHQAIATCLATSGISLGNLLINPLIGMAIKSLGWRTTWRIYSGVLLAIQIICFSLYRDPSPTDKLDSEKKDEREIENEKMEMIESNTAVKTAKTSTIKLLCNPGIILWLVGTLCWSCSFIFPLIFLVDFMKTSFDADAATANQVLIVFGVSELAGRVVGGVSGEKVKFSFTYLYAGFTIVAGLFTCITPFIHSIGWMFLYGFAAGITSGVANSIMFATCMQLFGMQVGNNIWGYTNVMVAIGAVGGPISAGKIYDVTKSYTIAFEIGGGLFIFSGLVMLMIEMMKKKFPLENDNQMENKEGEYKKVEEEKC